MPHQCSIASEALNRQAFSLLRLRSGMNAALRGDPMRSLHLLVDQGPAHVLFISGLLQGQRKGVVRCLE